jgi:MSHA biogenesis protein MshM
MYLSHFGLTQSPFGITPNPAFFFAGSARGEILEAMLYAVCHGEGIIKVTGEVGSGKTMLCRMLASMLPDNIVVIYLVNPTLSREDVVYAIAGELDLATGGRRPDEVIRMVQADLISKHVDGKQVVLLVEEAQAMPLDTLEEIRLFSNLETAHHKLLQIVLFGQPELDQNLALARMRQLKERITHSFKVPPMPVAVIPEFLMFRMRAAGYHGPDLFTRDAVARLAHVSEGIVRRINILADKTLLAAFADNTHTIRAKHVKSAIQDSEFSSPASRWWDGKAALAIAAGASLLVAAGLVAWARQGQQAMQPPASIPAMVAPPLERPRPMTILQQRLSLSKAGLASGRADHFSLQLSAMRADRREEIERFLKKLATQIEIQKTYLFPSRNGGVERYGIIYGEFATRAEAEAMALELSDQWGYRPRLRTIGGIRNEVQSSHAVDPWQQ